MKRSNRSKRDDGDEENGEPARERPPAEPHPDERPSGVRARGARPPLDQGPCTSFEEVRARYKHVVWRHILERLRSDPSAAEDVHQEVFLRLSRRIRERGSVPHPVAPVLAGLVEDALKNHVRGVKRRRIDGEPEEDMPSSKPDPEQLMHRAELKQRVQAIFARMDEEDVQLIELAHVQGLQLADVAELVGKLVGTVAVELHRARARFRDLYDRHHGSRRKP
jgi:RNA polymerase sigma-70 factor (ECF subfamily)